MANVTFTQEDLDQLKEALVSGASRVTIGDRTIEFRSKDELMELINTITKQLNGDTDDTSNDSTIVVGGFNRKPCGE